MCIFKALCSAKGSERTSIEHGWSFRGRSCWLGKTLPSHEKTAGQGLYEGEADQEGFREEPDLNQPWKEMSASL